MPCPPPEGDFAGTGSLLPRWQSSGGYRTSVGPHSAARARAVACGSRWRCWTPARRLDCGVGAVRGRPCSGTGRSCPQCWNRLRRGDRHRRRPQLLHEPILLRNGDARGVLRDPAQHASTLTCEAPRQTPSAPLAGSPREWSTNREWNCIFKDKTAVGAPDHTGTGPTHRKRRHGNSHHHESVGRASDYGSKWRGDLRHAPADGGRSVPNVDRRVALRGGNAGLSSGGRCSRSRPVTCWRYNTYAVVQASLQARRMAAVIAEKLSDHHLLSDVASTYVGMGHRGPRGLLGVVHALAVRRGVSPR